MVRKDKDSTSQVSSSSLDSILPMQILTSSFHHFTETVQGNRNRRVVVSCTDVSCSPLMCFSRAHERQRLHVFCKVIWSPTSANHTLQWHNGENGGFPAISDLGHQARFYKGLQNHKIRLCPPHTHTRCRGSGDVRYTSDYHLE
ncbi:hypothetical protein TNCV_2026091 [Trichonephila clavipes]|nr:hypothetical protein TNCV_2026091 [Trichonephila clavipes]